jgi:hypothetical protein
MTFQQVISALHAVRPDAEIGRTARRGKYYEQAIRMNFRRYDDIFYVADGRRGKEMWLYINEKLGRICCGNKG